MDDKNFLLSELSNILESSEMKKEIENALNKYNKASKLFTPLTKSQISALKAGNNFSPDWSAVKVKSGFNAKKIRNSEFFGKVFIGTFKKTGKLGIPAGIYNSKINNSFIGDDSLVSDVKLLSNTITLENCSIFNCGEINCEKETVFGNGTEISIAIETGGREVKVCSDSSLKETEIIAISKNNKEFYEKYNKIIETYSAKLKSKFNIFSEDSFIKNTAKIASTFVGKSALIDNACLISNTTILSNKDEKTKILNGSYVKDSIIQWGCEVNSMAIVDTSLLTEHSHVERHGKVTSCIVGPNTGIAEGECTASLIGPFVGFHHQALLIAAFWPEGKGNIGYGANVGSNHTSKAPDQEIWPGEGIFFGLGVNIKFPSDFTNSPYTIIATGVSALPQKVSFPFSLINSPSNSYSAISPAFNEIVPGWVLSDNIYTIKRNEGKYIKRNKAKRTKFIFEVFRPDIINMMIDAKKRLSEIKETKEVYTSKEIKGLGKNYLLESNRKKAIDIYTFYIQYYALLGLKRELEHTKDSRSILEKETADERWEHEKKIFKSEFPEKPVKDALKLLVEYQEKITKDVQTSKEKDDQRGEKIIRDYNSVHTPALQDSFVKETKALMEKMRTEIEALIAK